MNIIPFSTSTTAAASPLPMISTRRGQATAPGYEFGAHNSFSITQMDGPARPRSNPGNVSIRPTRSSGRRRVATAATRGLSGRGSVDPDLQAGVVQGRRLGGCHGACSCDSQTRSGSSARTRCWPSVRGSSSSAKKTAVSPATTTGRPPVSTTTICDPGVCPGAGTRRTPGRARARRRRGRSAHRARRPTRGSCSRPGCGRRRARGAGRRWVCRRTGGCRRSGRSAGAC